MGESTKGDGKMNISNLPLWNLESERILLNAIIHNRYPPDIRVNKEAFFADVHDTLWRELLRLPPVGPCQFNDRHRLGCEQYLIDLWEMPKATDSEVRVAAATVEQYRIRRVFVADQMKAAIP